MSMKTFLLAAALVAAFFVAPAYALDYAMEAPSAGDFGLPTSDETIYVNEENSNLDRSKNTAHIPPGLGTPTSYLPGIGEPLISNLAGGGGIVTAFSPGTGGTTTTPGTVYPSTAYTAVTTDLYYSGGYLATLNVPAIGLTVRVYQGTDSAQLAKGAGHFPAASIWDGNVAVAAHNRGVNDHFGQIHTLSVGDKITLTTKLGVRTYAVTDVFQVQETDSSMLAATADNCITLITCVRDQRELRWCIRAVGI